MKNKILTIIIYLFVILLIPAGCSNQDAESDYEKVSLNASWTYNYENVEELTQHSDIIAIVSISGMEIDKANSEYGVTMTKYSAKVEELVYGEDDANIEIIMTGGIDEDEKKIYEILDDPLMEKGDEFLVFAQKNEDGTYTVLSGSQGRFVIENGKVFSLNAVNEQVSTYNKSSNINVDGEKKSDFFKQISDALIKYDKYNYVAK